MDDWSLAALLATGISPYHHRCTLSTPPTCAMCLLSKTMYVIGNGVIQQGAASLSACHLYVLSKHMTLQTATLTAAAVAMGC